MRRVTIWFDGFENPAETVHELITNAQARVIGAEAEYSTKNPMNADSLELLTALESQPYNWPRGVRTPSESDALNTLTVVVVVDEEHVAGLLAAVKEIGEADADIMEDIPYTEGDPLPIRSLADEFKRRVTELVHFAGDLTPEQRVLNPGLSEDLAGVVTSPVVGPALTMEAIIAYMRGRGWTVEPREDYVGGHQAYVLVEQGGQMYRRGASLHHQFIEQISADARSAFEAADAARIRGRFN